MKNNPFRSKIILIKRIIIMCFVSPIYAINIDDKREDPFTDIDQYEAIVYLKIGNSVCSGAIIDHRTVLTAAHCLVEGQKVQVFTGDRVDEEDPFLETSSFIKLPENKRYPTYNGASYDLALISLKEPLLDISPLKLSFELPKLNEKIYISGFGLHGTGSKPDQDFDKKKRWGTNILSIIADESVINGESSETSPDKIILGFYFDKNKNSLESMISLGDSGSPLIISRNNEFSIVGVASWIKKNAETFNRGYGSSAGFSSTDQNSKWLLENNPLRNISTLESGYWNDKTNWNDLDFPSNYIPDEINYNSISARYYSVNLGHTIKLNETIFIDALNISETGILFLEENSDLNVLLNTTVSGGNLENDGKLKSDQLILDGAIFNNRNEAVFSGDAKIKGGQLNNDGKLIAREIDINSTEVTGIGEFISDKFINNGKLNAGTNSQKLGKMNITAELINLGIIEIDISNRNESDLIYADKLIMGGSLKINPLSKTYSGNSNYTLFNFKKSANKEFIEILLPGTEFGRLTSNFVYSKNDIKLELLNPVYETIGINTQTKKIGKYLDAFSSFTSKNFQDILNVINYELDDEKASNYIEDIVSKNTYEPFIERIAAQKLHKIPGTFISESEYSFKKGSLHYEANSSRFDINRYGINLTHIDIESDLSVANSKTKSESSSYQFSYKIPISAFDVYVSFLDEEKETTTLRSIKFNEESFIGLHNRILDIKVYGLEIEKEYQAKIFNITAGVSYDSFNIKTSPFYEELNSVLNSYELEDVKLNIVEPSLGIKRNFNFGSNKLELGLEMLKSFYNVDSYESKIKMDINAEELVLKEIIDLDEEVEKYIYISNVYNNSLYAKLSVSEKNSNEFLEFKIGYLF